VGKELEKAATELQIDQSLKVNLGWGNHKYPKYQRDEDTQASFLDKLPSSSETQGIVYGRSRDDEKKWHHPMVKELHENRRPKARHGILDVPEIIIEKPVVVEEENR